jgi:hypothetical protein
MEKTHIYRSLLFNVKDKHEPAHLSSPINASLCSGHIRHIQCSHSRACSAVSTCRRRSLEVNFVQKAKIKTLYSSHLNFTHT